MTALRDYVEAYRHIVGRKSRADRDRRAVGGNRRIPVAGRAPTRRPRPARRAGMSNTQSFAQKGRMMTYGTARYGINRYSTVTVEGSDLLVLGAQEASVLVELREPSTKLRIGRARDGRRHLRFRSIRRKGGLSI